MKRLKYKPFEYLRHKENDSRIDRKENDGKSDILVFSFYFLVELFRILIGEVKLRN